MSRAVTFTVSEFLRDELTERGWPTVVLAERMGVPFRVAVGLVYGRVPVSVELAEQLETATGVSAGTWLALQAQQDEATDG